MKVTVLFFAGLREQLGTSGEQLDLPSDVTSVAGLRSHLQSRGGAFEKAFSERALVRMAVNQDMVPATARIKAGDEIAFFPPVTGG